jgi:hypothetical protein
LPVLILLSWAAVPPASGADLTLEIAGAPELTLVGAVSRWDADGRARVPVDPKAKIDAPRVDARAEPAGPGRWAFRGLPPGRYDLVLLAAGRRRVEGFHYPPLLEFDPVFPPTARPPDEEARAAILEDIARSPHYENKVDALFLGGDEKQVRVLMRLVRDTPTSFDGDFGAPAATIRHEVWQYTFRYGAWTKERRTAILDRVLLAKAELEAWTWAWEPALGGIEVKAGSRPGVIRYAWPSRLQGSSSRGPSAR